MEKKLFCQHCSEDVLTYSVVRDGREEICCLYCGLPLQKLETKPAPAAVPTRTFILHADDSAFMRELVRDICTKNSIADTVESFEDGEKLIYAYTRLLSSGGGPSLVILDIKMPFITGIASGIALRAIERAFGKPQTPFLYFSVKQADDEIKKLIAHTAPSYFLNKGATSNIEELESRLVHALKSILKI